MSNTLKSGNKAAKACIIFLKSVLVGFVINQSITQSSEAAHKPQLLTLSCASRKKFNWQLAI